MIKNHVKVRETAPEKLPVIQCGSGKVLRGKAAPEYIPKGTVLCGKVRVEKMIGGGGFGQIYRATHLESGTIVAAKVEPESDEAGRMVLEFKLLTLLQNTRHAPRLWYSGHLLGYNFIVMQMLGKNLTEMRKAQRTRRLSVHTTVRIGIQATEALMAVHDFGYLHRDVKPSNMCVGIGDHRRTIYLVDFGMTRNYRRAEYQKKDRFYAAFRGTMRYVSVAVHNRQEQGPVDDFWCLLYTLIELAEGSLPWRNVTDNDEVQKQKATLGHTDLCSILPRSFGQLSHLLKGYNHRSKPDYASIINVLEGCCRHVDHDADFEWDEERSTQSE